jgi:Asp-tRNA(Asn)/Glu-tRNA(Gln) amidotransferase A subunit family amidase
LTEILFDQAKSRAKELDEKFKSSGPVGFLHGLPISFKDSVQISGTEATIGKLTSDGSSLNVIKFRIQVMRLGLESIQKKTR